MTNSPENSETSYPAIVPNTYDLDRFNDPSMKLVLDGGVVGSGKTHAMVSEVERIIGITPVSNQMVEVEDSEPAENSVLTRNYYLINKKTKNIHFLFKLNPYFLRNDGSSEAWLSGRVYRSKLSDVFTLEELHNFDYEDGYEAGPFEFMTSIDYASYKGYRIHNFVNQIHVYNDFAGKDFMEMNAFMATLFKEYIGPKEVEEWNDQGGFDDPYGVNEIIMKNFTIESDEDARVHFDNLLCNEYNWTGFEKHQ